MARRARASSPGVCLGPSLAEGPRQVAFDPYPFDVRPCRVQLSFKQPPQSTFEDVEAFRRAWFGANVGLIEFELIGP